MTRGLPQPEQRLENVHARSADAEPIDLLEDTLPVRREQRVVKLPLLAHEHYAERLLRPRRQIARDLLFRASQNHGLERSRQKLRVSDLGHADELREARGGAQHPWIQELE